MEYTTLAAAFCPPEFTISDLRHVYEIVWSTPIDPRNFHRKITSANVLVPVGRTTIRNGGRPAELYRLDGTEPHGVLYPPMLRP